MRYYKQTLIVEQVFSYLQFVTHLIQINKIIFDIMHPVAEKLKLTSDRFEGKHLGENAEHYIKRTKKKDRTGNEFVPLLSNRSFSRRMEENEVL